MKKPSESTSKKLKIGLVLDDTLDSTDGVQQYVLSVGRWLKQQGHEVHYLVGDTKRNDQDNIHSLSRNVKVRFNGNRLSVPLPASASKIRQVLKQDFDVLHVQVPYSPFLAGKLIKAADRHTAVIGTFHIAPYGQLAKSGARLLGLLSNHTIERFDKMLSVSRPAADMAKDVYHIKTEVLGNCFDFDRFNKAQPLKNHDDTSIEILFLGRLVKRKGCLSLLSALALLERSSSNHPSYHVVIAGDGPLRGQLEKYVEVNGLKEKVEFVGFIDEKDKPRYYASADIAVFPSTSGESFGFVLVEAMASGRSAIIAANNPGYATLLNDRPEMLFEAGDVAALTSKLKEYIYNPELRNSVAMSGKSIAERYDQNEIGSSLLSYYEEALRKRRG